MFHIKITLMIYGMSGDALLLETCRSERAQVSQVGQSQRYDQGYNRVQQPGKAQADQVLQPLCEQK